MLKECKGWVASKHALLALNLTQECDETKRSYPSS